ncbi:MAG: group III truncated hemoglobin [Acidimicrobiia bacterium]
MSPAQVTTKLDLDNRTEIHNFVVEFYRAIVFDDLLQEVFEQIAEVDWNSHIPRLVDYWCKVLIGENRYNGAMFQAHQDVHEIEDFQPAWFEQWHKLFWETLDAGWEGPHVEHAKEHALKNLGSLARRLMGTDWAPAL